jgi:hypothetical protein
MKQAPQRKVLDADLLPLAFTLCVVAWTAAVYKHSDYGTWHIYPALAWAPSVLISHVVLIVRRNIRSIYVLYAFVHLLVAVPVWVSCLFLISKDSL